MKYWMDTEFNIADGRIDLISIGIVAEDGREFYGVYERLDDYEYNEWVQRHVIPHLYSPGLLFFTSYLELDGLRDNIECFFAGDPNPELWGYYCAFDWFLFCGLWGHNFDNLPKSFPHICLDVKQLAIHEGVNVLPPPFEPQHNALVDARWTKAAWEYINLPSQWPL